MCCPQAGSSGRAGPSWRMSVSARAMAHPSGRIRRLDPAHPPVHPRRGMALERMRSSGYRHVPVVDDGIVVVIVSLRDLYAAAKRELEADLQQREAFIFDTGSGTG